MKEPIWSLLVLYFCLKWYVCIISAVVDYPRCLQNGMCCEAGKFFPVPVLPLHPDSSIPFKLGNFHSQKGCNRYLFVQLHLTALAHLEHSRTRAASVFLLTSFPPSHAPELGNGAAVQNIFMEFRLQPYAEQIQPSAKNSHFKTCQLQRI